MEHHDAVNFAFLNDYGMGGYDVDEGELRVIRIPPAYTFAATEKRPMLKVKLNVLLGFQEFADEDELEVDLARLRMWGVVPGIEAHFPVSQRWTLKPEIELGLATSSAGGAVTGIFATGIAATWRRPYDRNTVLVTPKIRYNTEFRAGRLEDDHIDLSLEVELRRLLGWRAWDRPMEPGVYVKGHYYLRELSFEAVGREDLDLRLLGEVGITFGARPAFSLWGIDLPRVGIGFIFGNRFRGLRIRFG